MRVCWQGPTRDEYLRRIRSIVDGLVQHNNASSEGTNGTNGHGPESDCRVDEAARAYKDLKLPERLSSDAAHTLFAAILKLDEAGRETGSQLLYKLRGENLVSQDKLWEGLKLVRHLWPFYKELSLLYYYYILIISGSAIL